ncbi:hypothetical protein L914_06075, partial [Phytophthora nicotianae]
MACMLIMLARYDPERAKSRTRLGNLAFLKRFLKRNRLTLVGNVFSQSIQHEIEEDGILASEFGDGKLAAIFNMDQTAIYIDMAGKTNRDFTGNYTIDVPRAKSNSEHRVFLAASATGAKLAPLIVFTGVPGGPVSQEVWDPAFGSPQAEHTVQKKVFFNEQVMMQWIERPSADGCRLLILDSLK